MLETDNDDHAAGVRRIRRLRWHCFRLALRDQWDALRAPARKVPQVEECFVLEGAVTIDGQDYGPGDYTIAQAGTRHGTIVSAPAGSFCFIGTLRPHWARALRPNPGLYRQP
jgi:hypothetical protein